MRKIDPRGVRDAFDSEMNDLLSYFDRVAQALAGTGHEQGDISRLAETMFLAAFVSFERFLSDLFFAYMNRDFSAYQRDLSQRVHNSVRERFGQWSSARIRFNPKQHVNMPELENILDPDGWNLTFKNVVELRDKADRWLATRHRNRVHSLTVHDVNLIDTARAIRNFIAHQSVGSKKAMNEHLATVSSGAHNRHLGRGTNEIHNVGSFLKAVFAGDPRLTLYVRRLQAVSRKM